MSSKAGLAAKPQKDITAADSAGTAPGAAS
jgi:hypothetical protein